VNQLTKHHYTKTKNNGRWKQGDWTKTYYYYYYYYLLM